MKIEHVALWTSDLERSRKFYETYFGATAGAKYTNERKQFSSYFLSFSNGARLEIMQRPSLREADDAECPRVGYAHIAVSTSSEAGVDALTQRLSADGYSIIDGPRRTGDGYYESVALDPDGNRIEITA